MPEIKHYSCLIAELVFPVVIFFLCLAGMLSMPKEEGGDRLHNGVSGFFVMLNQIAIMAWFRIDFYDCFYQVYEELKEEREILLLFKEVLGNVTVDVSAK